MNAVLKNSWKRHELTTRRSKKSRREDENGVQAVGVDAASLEGIFSNTQQSIGEQKAVYERLAQQATTHWR